MPNPTNAKPRSSRIPMDYFRHADGWTRWKARLTWLVTLVGVAAVAFAMAAPVTQRSMASRGPLTAVHTAWNTDCAACHREDFSFSAELKTNSFGNPCAGGAMDQRCNNCHNGGFPLEGSEGGIAWAGAFHHPNSSPGSTTSCSGCHHDHNGTTANLTRISDAACANCHNGLESHAINAQALTVAPKVVNFVGNGSGSHPEFRAHKEQWTDPGSIKFNHSLHMSAGMGQNYTLKQVGSADQQRYKNYSAGEKGLMQLDCAACHHLDSSSTPGGAARQAGGVFQPIAFERDCKACHSLGFTKEKTGEVVEAPHKVQPAELKAFVEASFAREFLADQGIVTAASAPMSLPPLPGKPFSSTLSPPDRKAFDKAYGTQVRGALTRLMSKAVCAECHHLEGDRQADNSISGFGDKPLDQLLASKIQTGLFKDGASKAPAAWLGNQSSPIPLVWQPKARFNHASHRAWDCATCHAQVQGSTKSADINLPKLESCQSCHGPARNEVSTLTPAIQGGARHDCLECHVYHQASAGLAGLGNAAWTDPRGTTKEHGTATRGPSR